MRRYSAIPLYVFIIVFGLIASDLRAEGSYYVHPEDLPATDLPGPYAEKSDDWVRDVNAVIAAQQVVTMGDLFKIKREQHLSLNLITDEIGFRFIPQNYPRCYSVLNKVFADTGQIVEIDKEFYHTRRPYLADHEVKLFVDPIDKSPSYPSGHTTESRVIADILSNLFPDFREHLKKRADEISWHRVEAGVHYPHDLDGGRRLASLVEERLKNNAQFEADLAACRQEIAANPR